ncbi:AN1-type zinc finger protein Tmc1p [Trichomonascus vanleenenianus]|uniref:Tmc1p n=1 Tax=Trichomonascus vanleenenianus TaxID=2268995 RepID=UPI003ECA9AAE
MSSFQITIKSGESSLVVDVEPSTTIGELKQRVRDRDASIATDRLVYDGKPLDDSDTVVDYHIDNHSTLYFTTHDNTTQVTSKAPRKGRKRCSYKKCISAPLRGVGDCGFCDGRFCSKHRLMEQHDCIGLHNCKQQMHERNAVKLQEQQTVANKV